MRRTMLNFRDKQVKPCRCRGRARHPENRSSVTSEMLDHDKSSRSDYPKCSLWRCLTGKEISALCCDGAGNFRSTERTEAAFSQGCRVFTPPEPMAGEEGGSRACACRREQGERPGASPARRQSPTGEPCRRRRDAGEMAGLVARSAGVDEAGAPIGLRQPFARPDDPCDRKRIWHASGRRGKELTVASVKCQRFSPAGDLHITAQPGRRPTSAPAGSACRTCVAHPPGPR